VKIDELLNECDFFISRWKRTGEESHLDSAKEMLNLAKSKISQGSVFAQKIDYYEKELNDFSRLYGSR
jgi:hypothetical protein